jgi:gluconolactonase
MNTNKRMFLTSLLAVFTLFVFADFSLCAEKASSLIAPGATIKTVKTGFNGTEGPAADADGNIYFTERSGSTIQKWTWSDNKVSMYREVKGGAIGQAFDVNGNLLTCEMENGRITKDDLKGSVTVLADFCDGKKLHIPNDLWVDNRGGIYFTDFSFASMKMPEGGMPGAGAPGGAPDAFKDAAPTGEKSGQPGSGATGFAPPRSTEKINPGDLGINYISPDGKKVTRAANLDSPNGITGTPDGILYALDQGKIWSWKINPDGTLTDKKVFCNTSTDGMALDEKGNVYLTDNGISIYNPKGEKIEEISLPKQQYTNLKFGGKDRKTLFICGATTIYTLEMAVMGAPSALDLAKGKK